MGLFDKSLKEIGKSLGDSLIKLADTSPKDIYDNTKKLSKNIVETTKTAYAYAKLNAQKRKLDSIASFIGLDYTVNIKQTDSETVIIEFKSEQKNKSEKTEQKPAGENIQDAEYEEIKTA